MEENRLLGDKDEPASEDGQTLPPLSYPRISRPGFREALVLEGMLLILSAAGNAFQYWYYHHVATDSDRSIIAGVTNGVVRPFVTSTEWSSENTTHADGLWNALAPGVGMVAVDNDFSRKMNLYTTEQFPWDQSKGIYMLEGYHSLHCLMYIYRALREFEQSLPQTIPMHHHIHCLDALRENAICSADDTLRPAGSGMVRPHNSERRPQKQCRNWDQLKSWALQNSACFKKFPDKDPRHNTLDEWTWCPDGSPYIPTIEAFFGRRE